MTETGSEMTTALDYDGAVIVRIYAKRGQIVCRETLLTLRYHDQMYSAKIKYDSTTRVDRHSGDHTVLSDEASLGKLSLIHI